MIEYGHFDNEFIIFRIAGNLGIFSPNDFASLCHKVQFIHICLNNSTFGNYEVLLFRNDCESCYHCYTLESLSSTLFEILGRVSL